MNLTPEAVDSLRILEERTPGILPEHLIETALAITAALYEKTSEGARVKLEYPDGKIEELRFKVKKPLRKKA